ncbi:TldD/PmbA family protein [Planktothrix sp. FACHB-1355]|uniref:TldD/PmbA family protein n=1 Tax=Aerosakkonema funiforme FACHB-1375 TaxID=2949571 RepID=A0A926ZLW4_9CYAN|nr:MULTISPECIES: TldD/PmbA family protein [Oscillatoriales]MBD2185481.1 TldD/PmbA family protein [Aerosakkonema funiforme FACHB-1375]MBD3562081.1 TldD/PmbA family protein [Planktothrix sp. FACHB-1355]
MQDRLLETIAPYRDRVDYLEIRLEQSESTAITFRGPQLDAVDRGFTLAGGIRACHNGGWSFVTFNGLAELKERIEEAISQAKLVGKETTVLAPIEPIKDYVTAELGLDPRGVSLAEKRRLMEGYNQLLLEFDPRIQTTSVNYRDRFGITYFVNSIGTCIAQERLDIQAGFGAIARGEGGLVRQGYESFHSRSDYNALVGIEARVQGAAQRAIRQLEAKSVKGGQYTVVLDPYLSGVFIHEAFGHLSEADFVYENPRMQELLSLGKPLAIEQLNVVDDATLPGLPGSLKYDDEGVPGQRKYLIEKGILTQRLHNRETAAKLQEKPTGNARAINATHPPIVRMTNTAIEAGEHSFDEMIADIQEGVYAVRMLGGQTNGEMFTFAAAEGYMIRNGKIAEPVSDVTLTGNVFQTLKDIEAIGNDSVYLNGGCGKGGQMPLPVSVGGPHIRIKNVVVGGR